MSHPFIQHLRRASDLAGGVLDRLDGDALGASLEQARLPELTQGMLRPIADGWMEYRTIAALAPSLVGKARSAACVKALAELLPSRLTESDITPLETAVARAVDSGSACGRATSASHPGLASYAPHLDHVEFLKDVSAHRWLALERGVEDGVLRIEYRFPEDLGVEGWLQDILRPAVFQTLHWRSQARAIWAGADLLIDLVTSPPVQETVMAVVRSGGKAAAVVRAVDGTMLWSRIGPAADIEAMAQAGHDLHPVSALVLAAGSRDLLDARWPAGVRTVHVRDVAMNQAAKAFQLNRLQALAQVLAERAQDPRGAWSRLDPATLGLVEYQQNLDPDHMRLVLSLAVQQAETRSPRVEAPKLGPAFAGVKQIDDLRPGMVVSGTVTQIAPFGAFVNIGIGTEALIHISQLSNTRVEQPTDVVHVGQPVTAKVLEVDKERRRISLTLRSDTVRPQHSDSSRKKALESLNKLFK